MYNLTFFFISIFALQPVYAQESLWNEKLNTAVNSDYMTTEEKNMIFEINKVRSAPAKYAQEKIHPLLLIAKEELKKKGKGSLHYSVTTTHSKDVITIDTAWHYINEEEVVAIQTLYDSLLQIKPLSILLPDKGIYAACSKHAKDQQKNGSVAHQGNDGSWPWERIVKYSPKMRSGNENIAYKSDGDYVDIVLLLLIDSGIKGYGHRYNLLDADWTHVACFQTKKPGWNKKWWIQNFGQLKN